MSADYYPSGQALALSVEVRSNGVLTDPDDLELRIMKPDDTELPPVPLADLTRASTGRYSYERPFVDDGLWRIRWQSTNPVGAAEDYFHVSASEFP